ncbi:NF-kappa-B inhibitor zeta [Trematomus bernacchii]|uniref:NF-kappa-B inhibitor zeta n=1 Tax=Trematomus bernacchii TaxID=40690 RepID=UPI00146D851A|nr:NF-kappa-B inhibitor zeta [Trematomus bernacchii]XP_033969198.1 NF-kappa-B inhibitor zeta [Trematomus bernacchii]
MGGRCKLEELEERGYETADIGAGLSPRPGETAAGLPEPDSPVHGGTFQDVGGKRKGEKCSSYDGDKVYLGVRVKMPVRDLLKKIRIDQGWEDKDLQEIYSNTVKGGKQRVKTRRGRRSAKRKGSTQSLEELAIIVEVLEEDLRTGSICHSPPPLMSSPTGYNSDDSDEMIPSPQSYMSYSPLPMDYQQTLSPDGVMHTSLQPFSMGNFGRRGECVDPQNHDWNLNNSSYFLAQLKKEESQLMDVSNAVLLAPDEHGRTALHKVVCIGKRALGYAIAKRMAALNSLDLKDSDGMTALLHAAKHNQHLMVADLICLGANVNETNNLGKTCLHLSAEKGYIRVLEVLKHTMMDGVYVDVEATDYYEMSVIQCASVALKATVRQLNSSMTPSQSRLQMLQQEQMMETLECLLQMCSYLHTMGSLSFQSRIG